MRELNLRAMMSELAAIEMIPTADGQVRQVATDLTIWITRDYRDMIRGLIGVPDKAATTTNGRGVFCLHIAELPGTYNWRIEQGLPPKGFELE